MVLVARLLIYLGFCGAASGAAAAAFALLALMGLSALPQSADRHASPRIAAWLERQALPVPDPPATHGPALTKSELQTLAARASSFEPLLHAPILAKTEDEPVAASPKGRPTRTGRRNDTRKMRAATTASKFESGVADDRGYQKTARELYAPERNH